MSEQTKSQQIMALYDGKRTTREIADLVGCRTEYVRVVARQRKGRGASYIDKKYMANEPKHIREGRLERMRIRFVNRYRSDPAFRARRRKSAIAWQAKAREASHAQ